MCSDTFSDPFTNFLQRLSWKFCNLLYKPLRRKGTFEVKQFSYETQKFTCIQSLTWSLSRFLLFLCFLEYVNCLSHYVTYSVIAFDVLHRAGKWCTQTIRARRHILKVDKYSFKWKLIDILTWKFIIFYARQSLILFESECILALQLKRMQMWITKVPKILIHTNSTLQGINIPSPNTLPETTTWLTSWQRKISWGINAP